MSLWTYLVAVVVMSPRLDLMAIAILMVFSTIDDSVILWSLLPGR